MTGEVCGARGLGQPETEPELEFASRGSTQHPEFTMPQPLRRDMKLLIKGGMSEIARSVIGGIPVSLFKRPAPSPMRRRPFALSRSPPAEGIQSPDAARHASACGAGAPSGIRRGWQPSDNAGSLSAGPTGPKRREEFLPTCRALQAGGAKRGRSATVAHGGRNDGR